MQPLAAGGLGEGDQAQVFQPQERLKAIGVVAADKAAKKKGS